MGPRPACPVSALASSEGARQFLLRFAVHKKAIEHLRRADPVLARIIKEIGPCRLRPDREQSPFEALIEAVCHQQLTGKAAQTILGRVKALHAHRPFPTPDDLLATPDDTLRIAGLSRAKIAAVKDIAAKTLSGVVPDPKVLERLDDAEIIERLTTIRGVGQAARAGWSATSTPTAPRSATPAPAAM